MTPKEWFFFFHHPSRIGNCIRRKDSWLAILGHVQAACYNEDLTWMFIDPAGARTKVWLTHHFDEVEALLDFRIAHARATYWIAPMEGGISFPALRPHNNCVTICASFLGLRAYTPWGLERMLVAHGAEKVDAEAKVRGR